MAGFVQSPHYWAENVPARNRTVLRTLRSQLAKARASVIEAKHILRIHKIHVDGGPSVNAFVEMHDWLCVIEPFVDDLIEQERPPRSTEWRIAIALRELLSLTAPPPETMSGVWAKAIRVALNHLHPAHEVEDRFASLKRQWDRDRAKAKASTPKRRRAVTTTRKNS
jgi:hypothetical protein